MARRLAGAAAAMAAVALVPVAFAGADHGVAPAANSSPDWVRTPGSGDVLWLLRSRQSDSDLGVSGRLPESAQLSAELLAALRDPGLAQVLSSGSSVVPSASPSTAPGGSVGVPGVVLDAYLRAAQAMAVTNPRCGLSWPVLAGIGRIESNHAHNGRVDAAGNTLERILGPALDGRPGFAAISASDGGAWTGDVVWEHAVGPMQFLPGTWKRYGVNAKGYGAADPNNIYDAALAAANFLCAGGGDLRDPAQLAAAVFRYNPSDSYVRTVLAWAAAYATGVTSLPSLPGMSALVGGLPGLPGQPLPGQPGVIGQPAPGLPSPPVPSQPSPTQPVPSQPQPSQPPSGSGSTTTTTAPPPSAATPTTTTTSPTTTTTAPTTTTTAPPTTTTPTTTTTTPPTTTTTTAPTLVATTTT